MLAEDTALQPGNTAALRNEILDLAHAVVGEVAEAIPENNYWGLAAYTVIAPEILSHFTAYALPQPDEIGMSWNYVDAACQGVTGLQQLFDQTSHRPIVTKTKGLFNLASGIQLMTLTLMGTGALGPIGFAAGAGVSFLMSMDEAIRQMRRLYSPEYFFVDTLAELDKTEELINQKIKSLTALKSLPRADRDSKSGKFAIDLAENTLKALEDRRKTLQHQMEVTLDAEHCEHREKPETSRLNQIVEGYNRTLITNNRCRIFLNKLRTRDVPSRAHEEQIKKSAQAIRQKTKKAIVASVADSTLWALAFTGLVLGCIPGMQLPAVALIAAASAIFLYKNKNRILARGRQISNFFSKDKSSRAKDPLEKEVEMMEMKHGKVVSAQGEQPLLSPSAPRSDEHKPPHTR
jgi:hypothetical protein